MKTTEVPSGDAPEPGSRFLLWVLVLPAFWAWLPLQSPIPISRTTGSYGSRSARSASSCCRIGGAGV